MEVNLEEVYLPQEGRRLVSSGHGVLVSSLIFGSPEGLVTGQAVTQQLLGAGRGQSAFVKYPVLGEVTPWVEALAAHA